MENNGYNSELFFYDKGKVEKELKKGFFSLNFSPEIEEKFKDYLYEKIKESMRFSIALGILIYFIFGILDYFIYPDFFKQLFFIRYLIGGPPIVGAGLLLMKAKKESQMQFLFSFALIVAGFVIITMIYLVKDPTQRYYAGLTVVLLYSYVAIGIRFKYTLIIGWSLIVIYMLGAIFIFHPTRDFLINNVFFLFFFNFIGMISSFWYEKNLRRLFLLSSLIAIERKELERANKKLKQLSITDPLTKIANRRYLSEFLRREWKRSIRYKEPISAIMIDIDFFKKYNDTLGHQKGDSVLYKVAKAIKKYCRRADDIIARFGGEEFIVILGNTKNEVAFEIAEKMRKEIEDLHIKHPASDVSNFLTISLGVATMIPEIGIESEILIKAADDALYKAKKTGRNKIGNVVI